MADYKEIFGSLVNKARGAMENSGVAEVYQKGAGRAKSYARIARLTLDLNGQAEELRKVYTEIGKLYFEQTRGSAGGPFAPLFAQAEAKARKLGELETEIAALRESTAENGGKDIEVEIGAFDDIVSADENQARGE